MEPLPQTPVRVDSWLSEDEERSLAKYFRAQDFLDRKPPHRENELRFQHLNLFLQVTCASFDFFP